MTASPVTRQSGSAAARALFALLAMLLLGACLFVPACGSADPQVTETTGTPVPTDPQALADAVVDVWSQSMQALVALIETKPEVSAVTTQVQTLKETAIQSLVALGHQRETLSDTDKAMVDSRVWAAFDSLADPAWYTDYNTLWTYYSGIDLEFANVVAGFNTLTQYSDFKLLKQQLPAEAARLGIE